MIYVNTLRLTKYGLIASIGHELLKRFFNLSATYNGIKFQEA